MKFVIVSLNDKKRIIETLNMFGFDIDNNQPDIVITYGGDGTILYSERKYPSVPKITLRGGEVGFRCMYSELELEGVLLRMEGEYDIIEETKLETTFKGRSYLSLNEMQVHNSIPTKAVRLSVYVDDQPLYWNVIGDGVVVATPFGSTAYFKSVGGIKFERGIGIALNNTYKYERDKNAIYKYSIADIDSVVCLKILREDGLLLFDNDENMIQVREGDEIIVKKAKNGAKFVNVIV